MDSHSPSDRMTNAESQDGGSSVIPEEETGTLYYTLDECYVLSKPGKPDGHPQDDSDVVYDTKPDEILDIDLRDRQGDYVKVELPIPGWIFLPPDKENELYEDDLDTASAGPISDTSGAGGNEYGTAATEENKQESKDPDDGPMTLADEEELGGDAEFGEMRRDYSKQRMAQLIKDPVIPDEDEKMWVPIPWLDRWLKKLVFLFRTYPFFPGLIIFVIQAVIETFILFDVYNDSAVAWELYKTSRGDSAKERRLQWYFMWSCIFIAAPYLIAWSAISEIAGRKLREHNDSCLWKMLIICFDVAPIGASMLFINDLVHWTEAMIKPVWQIVTWGRPWIRNISFEELGYYKLRRVSEIFAESICQTAVQLYILASGLYSGSYVSIAASLFSSILITCLWSTIILLEGRKNGMSFTEYTTVIFQGSFNFVPMLPAIERGLPTGAKVNWTYYKLNPDGVGSVGKALLARMCRLKFLKISTYTLARLERYGAKYFGSMIQHSPQDVTICVSRLEEEVRALFEKYDTDNDWSFDFWEFTRVSLMLKKAVKDRCLRSDVNAVFLDLADKIRKKVWLLDLIIKIRGSIERIPLLDFDAPLDYALDGYNFKMMSFLMAFKYDETSEYARREFQSCCTRAVTFDPSEDPANDDMSDEDKKVAMEKSIAAAMCLCEDKGVPIVVRVLRGTDLLAMDEDGRSDPYVRVDCLGIEEQTSIRKQTVNPIWEEDLLFILPFDTTSQLLAHANVRSGKSLVEVGSTEEEAAAKAAKQFGVRQALDSKASEKIKSGMHVPDRSTLPSYLGSRRIDASSFNMSLDNRADYQEHQKHLSTLSNGGASVSSLSENAEIPAMSVDEMKKDKSIVFTGAGDQKSRYSRAKSKFIQAASGTELVIKFRLHDYDVNDEDDFMGSHKIRIDLSDNTAAFHDELQRVAISHWQRKPNSSGTLEFRVYLNVLQYYQDHTLAFIDKIHESTASSDEALFEKMEKGNDKEQQLTYKM